MVWKPKKVGDSFVYAMMTAGRGWEAQSFFKMADGQYRELQVRETHEGVEPWGKGKWVELVDAQQLELVVRECRRDGVETAAQKATDEPTRLKQLYGVHDGVSVKDAEGRYTEWVTDGRYRTCAVGVEEVAQ